MTYPKTRRFAGFSSKKLTLSVAICLCLAAAQSSAQSETLDTELDEIIVTASPLDESADSAIQPVSVLTGKALENAAAGQLGQVLARIPGVQSAFFGAGVGRPIIRGLEGARVQTLSDGLSSMDAASSSPDHATPIEPILVDQIEVLKGPATLYYGSGAIGGVVNVVDGRLPTALKTGTRMRAQLGSDTASDLKLGALRVDYGLESGAESGSGWLLHLDATSRESDNYEIPGAAILGEPVGNNVLDASAIDSLNGAISATYFGSGGRFGVALSRYETEYGIPEAGEEEQQGTAIFKVQAANRASLAKAGEEGVKIDLEQDRVDLSGALYSPISGIEELSFRLGRNDYQHVEIEGGEQGTLFDVAQTDLRIEARQSNISASFGELRSAFGITHENRDFAAIGEEAFVPASSTKTLGAFWVAHVQPEVNSGADSWHMDMGLRLDRVKLDLDDGTASESDSLTSASLGLGVPIAQNWSVRGNLDYAERAPTAEERYSDGAHIATQSFELGDADLSVESARQFELGLHYHGEAAHFKAALFRNSFKDFIYQQPTDEFEDGLPVFFWTQDDATFTGAELEFEYTLLQTAELGQIELHLQADRVRGTLDDSVGNQNLPRISPSRVGGGFSWERGAWQANASVLRYFEQDRVADLETATAGYNMLDLDVSRSFGDASGENALVSEIYLQARNLGDQEARVHSSRVKDFAPLPGRNVGFGVRFYW